MKWCYHHPEVKYDLKSLLSFSQLNVWHPNWPFHIFPGGHLSPGCVSFWEEKLSITGWFSFCVQDPWFASALQSTQHLIMACKMRCEAYWEPDWTEVHSDPAKTCANELKEIAPWQTTLADSDFCSQGSLTLHCGADRKRSPLSVQPRQSDERDKIQRSLRLRPFPFLQISFCNLCTSYVKRRNCGGRDWRRYWTMVFARRRGLQCFHGTGSCLYLQCLCFCFLLQEMLKEWFIQKMEILSLLTHPRIVPNNSKTKTFLSVLWLLPGAVKRSLFKESLDLKTLQPRG